MVRFAPLNVPFHRRRQTAAVTIWAVLLPISLAIVFLFASYPVLWPFFIVYFIFMNFDDAAENGGRRINFIRNLRLWSWVADYFPVRIVREVELDASRNYIFGYHPHGIISIGAFTAFGTEGANYNSHFPGINVRLLTLDSNFKLPLYREIIMGCGLASVSRRSCENILSKGPGHSCMIVVGGATESLYAFPNMSSLILKKRLGFIKLAMRSGADLVPVYSFGENNLYGQLSNKEGTWLRTFQKAFQSVMGFTTPIFHGRGILNYDYGVLPFRHPVRVVVGKPVRVPHVANPSDDEAREVQKLYIDELQRIFDKYKDEYSPNRVEELTIIE